MRTTITTTLAVLLLAAAPAFAQVGDDVVDGSIPEPGVLALVGIGAAAILAVRRRKK